MRQGCECLIGPGRQLRMQGRRRLETRSKGSRLAMRQSRRQDTKKANVETCASSVLEILGYRFLEITFPMLQTVFLDDQCSIHDGRFDILLAPFRREITDS